MKTCLKPMAISPRAALSLPAGPELDRFVERYVLRSRADRQSPPPYSTDLETALAKVERKMNSREWYLRIEFDCDVDDEPSVSAYFEHPDWDGFRVPFDCTTVPEAICKSAICITSIRKHSCRPYRVGDVVKWSSDPVKTRKWTINFCLEFLLEPHVYLRSGDTTRLEPISEINS